MLEKITAIVKTFMRPEKFKVTLQYLQKAGIKQVVVAYDGPDHLLFAHKATIEEFSDEFDRLEFLRYPFNIGLSYCRNRMIERVDTEFILQLDDDQYIPKGVEQALNIFRKPKIGGVGFGWIMPDKFNIDAHDIEIINGYYVRSMRMPKKIEFIDGHAFVYPFDFIPNSAIFRKAVFDDVKWDENYIINREHEDYFLEHKKLGKWQWAIDLSYWIYHDLGGGKEFTDWRKGREARRAMRYFRKKWQLKGIAGMPRALTKLIDSAAYLGFALKRMEYWKKRAKADNIAEEELFHY